MNKPTVTVVVGGGGGGGGVSMRYVFTYFFAMSCFGIGLVLGQSPIQGVVPNL